MIVNNGKHPAFDSKNIYALDFMALKGEQDFCYTLKTIIS